jgi:hypothetical protein
MIDVAPEFSRWTIGPTLFRPSRQEAQETCRARWTMWGGDPDVVRTVITSSWGKRSSALVRVAGRPDPPKQGISAINWCFSADKP